jgi:hypothetical protein
MLSVAMVVLIIQQILEFMPFSGAIHQQLMNCFPVAFPICSGAHDEEQWVIVNNPDTINAYLAGLKYWELVTGQMT